MSQTKKVQRPMFCPHARLQWALDSLYPNCSRPSSPSSLITSHSETSSAASLPGRDKIHNNYEIVEVNGEGDHDFRKSNGNNNKCVSPVSSDNENQSCTSTNNCSPEENTEDIKGRGDNYNQAPTTAEEDSNNATSEIPIRNGNISPKELEIALDNKKIIPKKKYSNTKSLKKVSCAYCEIQSLDCVTDDVRQQSKGKLNYWKCLEPNCKIILCGAAGKNHAHAHYAANPGHMLQENTTSRRIWCNSCNHEVHKDWRNRRYVPAIWVHPESPNEPPRGLYNIGNTCFMNAALQNIASVSPLTSYLLGECSNVSGKSVVLNYQWLLREFHESGSKFNKGVMPSRLLHSVRIAHPIFRGFQQHDSQEFLRLFMDTIAEQTAVPHFVLDEANKNSKQPSSDNESETESFETCDSGNGSEETDLTLKTEEDEDDGQGSLENSEDVSGRPSKVIMKSIISNVFDGQIESSVQCLSCHQVSRRNEVFQDLSLPIPSRDEIMSLRDANNYDRNDSNTEQGDSTGWLGWMWTWVKSFFWGPTPTLEDCFAAFFSSDELKGKNMYSCEKCKKLRNGVKRCSLYKLPEVLCIHLKRFRMYEFNGSMGYSSKISQYVQFPLDGLDIRPYMHKDCSDEISTYEITGIICHMGSVMGGHYTSYIRKGAQWYLCDDSHIGPVAWETVMECEAYVLFYKKSSCERNDNRNDLFHQWSSVDRHLVEEEKFHLVSRKWLVQLYWGEEAMPLDNSDVVCPHGYIAPYENVEYGATWVPHCVWDLIMKRYGGGPDLKFSGECLICSHAWRKHQKAALKNGPGSRTHSISDPSGSPKTGSLDYYYANHKFSKRTASFTTTNSYSSNNEQLRNDRDYRDPELEIPVRTRQPLADADVTIYDDPY